MSDYLNAKWRTVLNTYIGDGMLWSIEWETDSIVGRENPAKLWQPVPEGLFALDYAVASRIVEDHNAWLWRHIDEELPEGAIHYEVWDPYREFPEKAMFIHGQWLWIDSRKRFGSEYPHWRHCTAGPTGQRLEGPKETPDD